MCSVGLSIFPKKNIEFEFFFKKNNTFATQFVNYIY